MGFRELSKAERVALATKAITERRSLIERWADLSLPDAMPWQRRASIVGPLLADCDSVADLGCGVMLLRPFLRPGTRYVPVDIVARDEETVVVDLNQQPLPTLDVDGWAVVGLLEYLFDVPALFRALTGTVVTTYNPVDLNDRPRLENAWVNSYDTAGLESVFAATGWRIVVRETLGTQRIWKLTRLAQDDSIPSHPPS